MRLADDENYDVIKLLRLVHTVSDFNSHVTIVHMVFSYQALRFRLLLRKIAALPPGMVDFRPILS